MMCGEGVEVFTKQAGARPLYCLMTSRALEFFGYIAQASHATRKTLFQTPCKRLLCYIGSIKIHLIFLRMKMKRNKENRPAKSSQNGIIKPKSPLPPKTASKLISQYDYKIQPNSG
ncbi:hypothetical protein ACMFMG_008851 [Clarireedia jacksonii]